MSEFVEQLRDVVAGFRTIECELEHDMLSLMLHTRLEEKRTKALQRWLQTGSDRSMPQREVLSLAVDDSLSRARSGFTSVGMQG